MTASDSVGGGDDVGEIKHRLDIVEIIGARVELKRSGRNHTGLCPFHSEKTPSFSVSQEKQVFRCYGCGVSGDVFEFVMRTEGLEFREALVQLAEQAGVKLSTKTANRKNRQERGQMLTLMEKVRQWYVRQLFQPVGKKARQLMADRGLEKQTIEDFGLGYAPGGGKQLLQYIGEDERELLHRGGLLGKNERGYYDFFRDRLMFPVSDRTGQTIAFCGRRLDSEKTAKYINSPESEIFSKGQVIYGLHRAMQQQIPDEFVVVEGHMDVISMAGFGWKNAVAVMGTALNDRQAMQLFRAARRGRILLCFDGDEAGQKAAWRAVEAIAPAIADNCEVRLALMPDGEDPDSLLRRQGPEALRKLLTEAAPLSEYVIGCIRDGTAETRSSDLNKVMRVLRQLPDTLYRRMLLRDVAAQCGLTENDLQISPLRAGAERRAGAKRRAGAERRAAPPPPAPELPPEADMPPYPDAGPTRPATGGNGQKVSTESLLSCLMQDVSLARELSVPAVLSEAAASGNAGLELVLAAIRLASDESAKNWKYVAGTLTGTLMDRPDMMPLWQGLLGRAEKLAAKSGRETGRTSLLQYAQEAINTLVRSQQGGSQALMRQWIEQVAAGKSLPQRQRTKVHKHLARLKLEQGDGLTEQQETAWKVLKTLTSQRRKNRT